jgi:hypothetical protein
MIAKILLLLAAVLPTSSRLDESVDMIELNHFHDSFGRHLYDQVIFYEWSIEHQRYHVRAWLLIEDHNPAQKRPERSYRDNRYHVRWHDRDSRVNRHVHSQHYRESWTQTDPERANKKLLDERDRKSLIGSRPLSHPEPLPQELPEQSP